MFRWPVATGVCLSPFVACSCCAVLSCPGGSWRLVLVRVAPWPAHTVRPEPWWHCPRSLPASLYVSREPGSQRQCRRRIAGGCQVFKLKIWFGLGRGPRPCDGNLSRVCKVLGARALPPNSPDKTKRTDRRKLWQVQSFCQSRRHDTG